MANDQLKAYQTAQRGHMSPREVEAMAFTRAALMLEEAKSKTNDLESFAKALRFNSLLWTIIQADITEAANQLPAELKANIMSLSIFIDKQTAKALRAPNPEDLEILITVNRNLAAGLRTNSAEQAAAAAG